MDTLYTDILLDLYRHPLNKKELIDFTVSHQESNPLCGDTVELFIKFSPDNTVQDIGWQGKGCAISQASASLVTDFMKNKTKVEMGKITKEEILGMLGLENLNPTRMRCALLILECIKHI